MIFQETPLAGAFLMNLERNADERGFFARAFCAEEFAAQGLPTRIAQSNLSYNEAAGTLRGMHYQAAPHEEEKLVRVIQGSLYDVIIDLRPGSSTYCRWFGVHLDSERQQALFIPGGMAHGFLTLSPKTIMLYEMFAFFHPASAGGVRYDDPAFGIEWPAAVRVISQKDRQWPDFQVEELL